MPRMVQPENWIKFLGTAGARYVTARQLRCSAGTFLNLSGEKIILDPGPGTLLRCARAKPGIDVTGLDAILLSHAHIDHSGDLNALTDAMTCGGWEKRGCLFLPEECVKGANRVLLNYIKDAPARVVILSPETEYELGGLRFSTSVKHQHDAETYGFRFKLSGGVLSFVTDTLFFDELAAAYGDSRWLVINVVRKTGPPGRKLKHMSLQEAEDLIDAIRPECAVLTHFGMTVIQAKPREIARDMSARLGLEVKAASDGMKLQLSD